jgi:hypothetical protein
MKWGPPSVPVAGARAAAILRKSTVFGNETVDLSKIGDWSEGVLAECLQ